MEKFELFSKANLGSVRTIFDSETGEILFFANDVASSLGYKNASEAISDHTSPDDRKALKYKAYSKTLLAEMWGKNDFMDKVFVNESGLYCMIFGSKLDTAKEFKRWIATEVLPSIRKHGGYIYGQENLDEEKRNELMLLVEKLSRDVSAYKADGDLWMEMYFKLEKDYLAATAKAVPMTKEIDAEIETPEYFVTPEGYIVNKALITR